jgi:hypothetical protein
MGTAGTCEGYSVAIANKANSGTSGLAAVVVTKTGTVATASQLAGQDGAAAMLQRSGQGDVVTREGEAFFSCLGNKNSMPWK